MHIFPKWVILTILYWTQGIDAGKFNQLRVKDCSTCFGPSMRVELTQFSCLLRGDGSRQDVLGMGFPNWPRWLEKNKQLGVYPSKWRHCTKFSTATNHRTCIAIILLGGRLPFKSKDIHHIHCSLPLSGSPMSKNNARISTGHNRKFSSNGILSKRGCGSEH